MKTKEERMEPVSIKTNPIYLKAKQIFNQMIAGTSQKDIEDAKKGFGIAAARFASSFIKPEENDKLYGAIYNIYYDYFKNLLT